ncbi:stealth family protein [Brachybacterium paraconglomeratum]|uniref:Stealth CR1 domain-containing protein n=1 Tax=Brachybacterium paraconglomeratum TaxID=173362 RepID=UPI0031EDC89A
MNLFERVRSSRLMDPVRDTVAWDAARTTRNAVQRSVQRSRSLATTVRSSRSVPSSMIGPDLVTYRSAHWHRVPAMLDREVYARNFELVVDLLERACIPWWWVDGVGHRGRRVIAVHLDSRAQVRAALEKGAQDSAHGAAWRITDALAKGSEYALGGIVRWEDGLDDSGVWRISECLMFDGSDRKLALAYGCDIEFWETDPVDDTVTAPRENRAARTLGAEASRLVTAERDGRDVKIPQVFLQPMLDDVRFPIDVVYTWVDGSDPAWLVRKARAAGAEDSPELHAEATDPARFRSRDELRYSLRSLDDFAPWVRHVYLVTDQQQPAWLDSEGAKLTIVDHRDIFPDDGRLPVFNSNAIISRLHHIEGLSEHFLYMNDDVMLTRPVTPEQFFTGSGLALVSPSNNRRPFIDPSVDHEPHLNITANIRQLMLDATGVNVSRAIKHTPHPMLRSVLYELEKLFGEAYEMTTRSQFRHHDDIVADQLHHYYAQSTARAVPGQLRYTYLNVLDDSFIPVFNGFSEKRDRDAICVNDAPVPGARPIPDSFVQAFLDNNFPAPSRFECRT